METKISWLSYFYKWETVSPGFFTVEDWININGSIQLIRIDPEIAGANMFVATAINYLGDFQLYQCDVPSEIRSNVPMRFFYSKDWGKFYELKGNNEPFYEIMRFLTIDKHLESTTRLDPNWYDLHLVSYIKVFFDNVKGMHGRFTLIENYDPELLNRILTYEIYSGKKISPPFSWEQKDFQRRIYDLLKKSIPLKPEKEKSTMVLKNVFMYFKNVLFRVEVIFDKDKDTFGQISLRNEIELGYHHLLKDQGREDEKFKKYPAISELAYIPVDQL